LYELFRRRTAEVGLAAFFVWRESPERAAPA
jgi:hypothetical protein